MPSRTAHQRSRLGRLLRLGAPAACIALVSLLQARGNDDPPREDRKPAGRILVRGIYCGTEPGAKPEGIVAIDPETAQAEIIYPILSPGVPSPDGRFIVDSQRGIWVYDTGGDVPPRRIFDQEGEPAWTDHGKSLVIAVNVKDDRWETWRVGIDGAARVKLPIPDSMLVLDASPDGGWLAARTVGGAPGYWGRLTLMRPDGTGVRHLTDGSANRDVFSIFRFSPDGREIAYVEVKTVDGIRTSRLFIADLDGKGRRELPIPLERGITAVPSWSPDGSRLALGLAAPQASSIAVVDRDGKNFRRLPLPPWPWFFTICGWSR